MVHEEQEPLTAGQSIALIGFAILAVIAVLALIGCAGAPQSSEIVLVERYVMERQESEGGYFLLRPGAPGQDGYFVSDEGWIERWATVFPEKTELRASTMLYFDPLDPATPPVRDDQFKWAKAGEPLLFRFFTSVPFYARE